MYCRRQYTIARLARQSGASASGACAVPAARRVVWNVASGPVGTAFRDASLPAGGHDGALTEGSMTTLFDAETEKRFRARVDTLKPDAPARWGRMNARQMRLPPDRLLPRGARGGPRRREVDPAASLPASLALRPHASDSEREGPYDARVSANGTSRVGEGRGEWNTAFDRFLQRSKEKEPRWGPTRIRRSRHRGVGPARRPPLRPPPDAVRSLNARPGARAGG